MKRLIVGVGPAALLVLIGLWELVATAMAGRDVGRPAEWGAAAAIVRGEHRPGDLIVFAPRWIDPVGRSQLGDLIPVEMAARMDAARYGRIWELSIRGARSPDTRGAQVALQQRVGPITVRRYEREPVAVVTDFVDVFPAARVEGKPGTRSRDRNVAPAVDLEEVGFGPHRCVRVMPPPGGSVRVVYPTVELGTSLVGYVGLADVFTRRDDRAPIRLSVEVGGQPVVSATAGNDDGWVRFEAATAPGAAEVAFVASALGADARNRLVCFAAEARR